MARLHERGFDIERVDFIQHALDQSLDRVLGGAEGAQTRHAERAAGAAENEISAPVAGRGIPLAEIGQRELEDVQCAPEIGLELVADLEFVLVFAGADDAVAGAVGDYVDAGPVRDASFENRVYGFADADVAEEGEVGLAGCHGGGEGGGWAGRGGMRGFRSREPGLHGWDGVGVGAANRCNEVAMGESGFDDGAADVACCPEDLENIF